MPLQKEPELSFVNFCKRLSDPKYHSIYKDQAIGVAVSGGPDSMALCDLIARWAEDESIAVHALSVDHGLREESSREALWVQDKLSNYSSFTHTILKWEHDCISSKIQESARQARYELMCRYCEANKISNLFLGHHMNDQAETFLFRLAKGSGLDGLSCMRERQKFQNRNIYICRPFLDTAKSSILEYCEHEEIEYIEDPSNQKEEYARVRLRNSKKVLEKEGLTTKRISITAKRMARARDALEKISDKAFLKCCVNINSGQIDFDLKKILEEPEELIFRIIKEAAYRVIGDQENKIRTERLERVLSEICAPEKFVKQTLGGLIFEIKFDDNILVIRKEH